jgi:hypothetical protein
MATGTLKMIPPVRCEPTTSHIASGAVQDVEGPRAGRVRPVAACQGSQRRTFSFLGRHRNCSRSGPTRRGSTLVLEWTKLAPDGGAHAQL